MCFDALVENMQFCYRRRGQTGSVTLIQIVFLGDNSP